MDEFRFADILFTGLTLVIIFAILRWVRTRSHTPPHHPPQDTPPTEDSVSREDR